MSHVTRHTSHVTRHTAVQLQVELQVELCDGLTVGVGAAVGHVQLEQAEPPLTLLDIKRVLRCVHVYTCHTLCTMRARLHVLCCVHMSCNALSETNTR